VKDVHLDAGAGLPRCGSVEPEPVDTVRQLQGVTCPDCLRKQAEHCNRELIRVRRELEPAGDYCAALAAWRALNVEVNKSSEPGAAQAALPRLNKLGEVMDRAWKAYETHMRKRAAEPAAPAGVSLF
jgi:hypothetical protein